MTVSENGIHRTEPCGVEPLADLVGTRGKMISSTGLGVRTQFRRFWTSTVASCHWSLLLLILVLLLLYGPVILELARDWYKDGNNAHGFLVPVVSAYLVWRKRNLLKRVTTKPSFAGLLVILASLGLFILGSLGAEPFLMRVSLIGNITGLILYFGGRNVLHALLFPIVFLLLMIPIPGIIYYQLMFPLQLLASRLVMYALDRLNYFPVVREGNLLILPHYTLEVVDACSGVRSLVSLLALALGYGYIVGASRVIRGSLALAVVPLAIVSNAFRVMLEAFIVHYYGVRVAEGWWHESLGLITFTSSALLLFVAERLSHKVTRTSHMIAFAREGQSLY